MEPLPSLLAYLHQLNEAVAVICFVPLKLYGYPCLKINDCDRSGRFSIYILSAQFFSVNSIKKTFSNPY